jgi:hypothetical protein
MATSTTKQERTSWWGRERLPSGATARWRIGSFSMAVRNDEREWLIAWDVVETEEDRAETWSYKRVESFPEGAPNLERYLFRERDETLGVMPLLADRPVVTSPRMPVFLLPGESARLYVGSPVWVRIEVEMPPKKLSEFPIVRPSDTWFGPSTLEGELCYFTRTRARLNAADIPRYVRYAMTPVVIRNHAPSLLPVERLKLPVPFLTLYATSDGRLWTQEVTLTRHEEGDMAAIEARPGAPDEAPGAERIGAPRMELERDLLTRAFSTLTSIFDRQDDGS